MSDLDIIGRAERVSFPSLGVNKIPAKVDTGADVSSIWCSHIELMSDGELRCVFFGPGNPFYTGKTHAFSKKDYTITRVANSFGHRELRYKVKIPMKIKKRIISATFTLSDRSQKLYPVLIGRYTLSGKFLVDVQKGNPLKAAERAKVRKLKEEMSKLK